MESFFASLSSFLGLPIIASVHGVATDRVILITHLSMFVLFIGWGSFFIFTLVRFSAKRHPKANAKGVQSHTSTYLEICVALFEVFLLIGFSIPLWSQRVNAFPPEKDAVVVRVVAEQFAWNVHYPGPDGKFGKTDVKLVDAASNPLGIDRNDPDAKDDFTTINQLHLPVGRKVIVNLSSKDVIHSFGVPLLRVKQDAIPGMVIPLWFEPNRPGQYEIACSQLCGLGHYRMKGFITVETPEAYQTWFAQEVPVPSEGGGDNFWQ